MSLPVWYSIHRKSKTKTKTKKHCKKSCFVKCFLYCWTTNTTYLLWHVIFPQSFMDGKWTGKVSVQERRRKITPRRECWETAALADWIQIVCGGPFKWAIILKLIKNGAVLYCKNQLFHWSLSLSPAVSAVKDPSFSSHFNYWIFCVSFSH